MDLMILIADISRSRVCQECLDRPLVEHDQLNRLGCCLHASISHSAGLSTSRNVGSFNLIEKVNIGSRTE
jgi:hypothetical protein